MRQQWTISWSDCDVWPKVEFIWQLVMTSSVAGPRRSSKALPKAKLAAKKRSWSLFGGPLLVWIPVKPLHLRWTLSKLMRSTEKATSAAGTSQEKGPSSPQQCLTTRCTSKASKVEWTGLRSFVSSAIFTWLLENQLPLLQASWQLSAGKMLPQPGGGRKCFPRVCRIPKHRFLCYRNQQTYFSLAKMCWL